MFGSQFQVRTLFRFLRVRQETPLRQRILFCRKQAFVQEASELSNSDRRVASLPDRTSGSACSVLNCSLSTSTNL